MTVKYRVIDWKFNRVKLAQEIVYAMSMRGLLQEEIASASGVSDATIAELREGRNKNPELKTLLGVINALDLDPRDYFQLED